MVGVLLIVLLLSCAGVGVSALVRRLGYRGARGHSFRRLEGMGVLPDDVREVARLIAADRARRRSARHRGDLAYASMRTVPKPAFSTEQLRALRQVRAEVRSDFLDHLTPGPYHYVIIFLIASVAGLVLEMAFMYVTAGRTELRVGLVWGPFSPLYGFGAVLLTMVLWNFRDASAPHVFLASAVLGGGLEQATGMLMQDIVHAQSWTYIHLPDHITQWVAWRFLAMWGLIGLVWCRLIMPEALFRIGEPTTRAQVVIVSVLTVFLVVDMLATVYCFYRKTQRDAGLPARNAIDAYVDRHFDDRFIAGRFQNLVIGKDL